MKLSAVVTLATFSAGALAAPFWDKNWKNDWKNNDWKNNNKVEKDAFPFKFTSTYKIVATPDQVVNQQNQSTGGLAGAKGYYDLGINSKEDYICFNIVLEGFRGEYQSAAKTATHLHEAVKGKAGPPRLAFPNPEGDDMTRVSRGCLMAPYTTGIIGPNGMDTGAGFSVKQIEDNPKGFFVDVHSSLAVPGAVRGQVA